MTFDSRPYGNLTVICGPMFAGKTTELLKRLLWARTGESRCVLALKTVFDTRYADTKIVSHDGLSFPAHAVKTWTDVTHLVADAEVIAFDEVQFFTRPHLDDDTDIVEIIRNLLRAGKDIVACGLDMDYRGVPFEVTARLCAMADNMVKLTAHCAECGRPAGKTFKKGGGDDQVELGSGDLYEPRCNLHWTPC